MKKFIQKWRKLIFLILAGFLYFGNSMPVYGESIEGNTHVGITPEGKIIISVTEKKVQEGEKKVQEGEKEVSDKAMAETQVRTELERLQKQLSDLEKKLEGNSKDSDTLTKIEETKAAISQKKVELKEKENARIEAGKKLVQAYQELAAIYEAAGLIGDPVLIGTGNYSYQKTDFTAEDFLEPFTVYRSWKPENAISSFGKNWTCSLDTRILRGRNCYTAEIRANYKEQLELLEKIINDYGGLNYFSNGSNTEYITQMEKCKNKKSEINEALAYLDELDLQNKDIDEQNKYVSYGYYSTKENLNFGSDTIVFVNKDGDSYICNKTEENKWIPENKKAAVDFSISYENDEFTVSYRNGTKEYFDKNGVLSKIEDRNKNQILFFSENGVINKIQNKTGEVFQIERNAQNQILKISGKTSGTAQFLYSKNNLVSVTNNSGISESYEYDSDGNLTGIITGADEKIKINYEYYSAFKKKMVSAVTNQAGNTEKFVYDSKNHKVQHTTYAGSVENYQLDESGATTEYTDAKGINKRFAFNDDNLISDVFEKNQWKHFYYNEFYEPVKTVFEDGCSTVTQYNSFGQICFQSNKDGFTNEVVYDEKGNAIQTKYCDLVLTDLTYYENGLVKSVIENGITYLYEYNSFGKITECKKILPSGKMLVRKYEYDDKNRLIKDVNWDNQSFFVSYGDNTVTEKSADMKVVHYLDSKQREFKTEQTDLKTGITYTKKIIYDKLSRPVKILFDDKPYLDYEYNQNDLVTGYTIWNLENSETGLKREFSYDEKDRLVSESCGYIYGKELTQKENLYSVAYTDWDAGFKMSVRKGVLDGTDYIYNNAGQLTEISKPDGSKEFRTYTKAGKIDSIVNEKKRVQFSYHNDGKTTVTATNENGKQSVSVYDSYNQLVYQTDYKGNIYSKEYDSDGNLVKENNGNCYAAYEYDDSGNLIFEKVFDASGKLCYSIEYEYDLQNRIIKKVEGGKYFSQVGYDAWGRISEIQNEHGKTEYSYDVLGNVISKTDAAGNKEEYKYSLFGTPDETYLNGKLYLENSYSASGKILVSKEFGQINGKWDYDDSGNCVSVIDELNNQQNFVFDSMGYVTSKSSYESGNTKITYDFKQNKISIENLKGNSYVNQFDNNDNLVWEQDTFGNQSDYKYDDNNRLIYRKDFEGNTFSIEYDDYLNERIQSFSDGNKYSVKKNCLGNIVEMNFPDGNIYYEYDNGNKLSLIKDEVSGIEVFYGYDNLGRCIQKKSSSFELDYDYDATGNVIAVKEKSDDSEISMEYDCFGRETKRKFSNGVVIYSDYNEKGQKNLCYAKEPYGLLLAADITVFDESGKKKLSLDKDGKFIKYDYDSKGRLISCEYSYEDELIENARNEAVECGLFLKSETPESSKMNISYEDYSELSSLMLKTGSLTLPEKSQESWKETYTYNETGSINSVENAFGTILYEYDSENRLIQKHGTQTESGGIHYSWNKNGCLLKIESAKKIIEFKYGNFERPECIITKNLDSGDVNEVFYTYDSLGRKISEQVYGQENHRFIYDGFSGYVLVDTPAFGNNKSVLNYENNLEYASYENSTEVLRTVDMSEFGKFNEFRLETGSSDYFVKGTESETKEGINSEGENSLEFENRPSVSMYVNGTLGAYVYYDSGFSNGKETNFLILNSSGTNVIAEVDEYGNCNGNIKYDAWGQPLIGKDNWKKEVGFSSSRNALRVSECILDLGNRDYIPSMKSFMEKDPAKDGINWFAYCACDPVNYSDLSGLHKRCMSDYEKSLYDAAIAGFLLFDSSEYHDTGVSAMIQYIFDCADVSSAVDSYASNAAGISGYSKKGEQFKALILEGKYKEAKDVIASADFYSDKGDVINHKYGTYTCDMDSNESFEKTGPGYNRDKFISSGWTKEKSERQAAYDNLRNPDNVTPGTVLVWKCNATDGSGEWTSHTMTVVARNYDAEGNVIGITYIEGHTNGGKTTVGYMNLSNTYVENVPTLDSWVGNFLGTYEIESPTTRSCGQ